MGMLLMPMSAGIGLVAADAVTVVLGEKWRNATVLIQALALFAVVKSVSPLSAQILISRGRADAARRQSLMGLAVLPLAFLFASRYGAVAVALVWTTLYPFLVAFQIHEASRDIELSLMTIARRLWPITFATLLMSGAVYGVRLWLAGDAIAPALRLAVCVAVGAAAYAGAIAVLAMDRLRAALAFVRARG